MDAAGKILGTGDIDRATTASMTSSCTCVSRCPAPATTTKSRSINTY